MTKKTPFSISNSEFATKKFHPSPICWQDEVIYFLEIDRFSDGNETARKDNTNKKITSGTTPMCSPLDSGNATTTTSGRKQWKAAGNSIVGGTLKGLETKTGYLKRLGITAIRTSPVFKPVTFNDNGKPDAEHSIEIAPHFGSGIDLQHVVTTAHKNDIRIILDINLAHNHALYNDAFAHTSLHDGFNRLCDAYKYWIALTDIDGFIIDSFPPVDNELTRTFCTAIHEFTQSIGKENFLLAGTALGTKYMPRTLFKTGFNAVLDIHRIPRNLEHIVKGRQNPEEYFDFFNDNTICSSRAGGIKHSGIITMFDDNKQLRKDSLKSRFCYNEHEHENNAALVSNVLVMNVMTQGIPCIYYGTEQCFNGHGNKVKYIRESMFGGEFGAFESKHRHFFNEDNPVYTKLSGLLKLRKNNIILRRGRQYLRSISGNGIDFGFPRMLGGMLHSIVPWSRVFNNREVLIAINTDPGHKHAAWTTIDNDLHQSGDTLTCIYSTDNEDIGKKIYVEQRNGKSVYLSVPTAGCVIYQ